MKLPEHIESFNDMMWGAYRCRECGAIARRGCSYSPDLYLQHKATCSRVTPVGPGVPSGELVEKAMRKSGDPA